MSTEFEHGFVDGSPIRRTIQAIRMNAAPTSTNLRTVAGSFWFYFRGPLVARE